MPTYDYECKSCGRRLETQQGMAEMPLMTCPDCGGRMERLITGGGGFIMKGGGAVSKGTTGCSLESTGRTCCGREQRCGKPECGD